MTRRQLGGFVAMLSYLHGMRCGLNHDEAQSLAASEAVALKYQIGDYVPMKQGKEGRE